MVEIVERIETGENVEIVSIHAFFLSVLESMRG
jgi:hypothetical protein